jgi:hypothetical protein
MIAEALVGPQTKGHSACSGFEAETGSGSGLSTCRPSEWPFHNSSRLYLEPHGLDDVLDPWTASTP